MAGRKGGFPEHHSLSLLRKLASAENISGESRALSRYGHVSNFRGRFELENELDLSAILLYLVASSERVSQGRLANAQRMLCAR